MLWSVIGRKWRALFGLAEHVRRHALGVSAIAVTAVTAGCAADILRTAPPEAIWRDARPVDAPAGRFWVDRVSDAGRLQTQIYFDALSERFIETEARGETFEYTLLALSGGAADGAYGAGLLNGWTTTGDRPTFDVVTGVSTGALIAPFAFLGSDYDPQLKEMFTETSTEDLLEIAIFSALTGALGLADVAPFQEQIARYFTADMLAEVAAAHDEGRRLYIATTNLDARRGVIWDMGMIAKQGTPEALRLFRKVMLASASIPGAFPPVYFDVAYDGRRYQELHVDGGVAVTVFVAPAWLELNNAASTILDGRTTIYVIQNNKIVPSYGPAEDSLVDITSTSISEMIRTQARGDQLRIFTIAERNGFKYQVSFVPESFAVEETEPFDPIYMGALFDVGFERAVAGVAWSDEPPALPASLRRRPSQSAELEAE